MVVMLTTILCAAPLLAAVPPPAPSPSPQDPGLVVSRESAGPGAEGTANAADSLGPAIAAAVREYEVRLGNLEPQNVQVRKGWLAARSMALFQYLNADLFPDAEPLAKPGGPGDTAFEALVATRDELAAADVELLVVIFPTRLNLYPECFVDVAVGEDFAGYAPGLERFLARLSDAHIAVLDLLPPFAAERGGPDAPQTEQVGLTFNGHWSPKGLALGARLLADEIRSRPWYEAPDEPPSHARARLVAEDILWGPTENTEPAPGLGPQPLRIERVVGADGRPIVASDPTSPVVLLGDSFSTIYSDEGADFPRHLAYELGAPVDVIASPGGGPYSSRAALARRRNGLRGKRLVIWTFYSHSLMNRRWWMPK